MTTEPDLTRCIPTSKFDEDAVDRAAAVGFPDLTPILPDLLAWTKDPNWPVAAPIFDLLRQAGPEIVPHLRGILEGEEPDWSYAICVDLIPSIADEAFEFLRPALERIGNHPTSLERTVEVDKEVRALLQARSKI